MSFLKNLTDDPQLLILLHLLLISSSIVRRCSICSFAVIVLLLLQHDVVIFHLQHSYLQRFCSIFRPKSGSHEVKEDKNNIIFEWAEPNA